MPSLRKLKTGAIQASVRFRGVNQCKSFPTKKLANAWANALESNIRTIGAFTDDQIAELSSDEIEALGGQELFTKLNVDLFSIQNKRNLTIVNQLTKTELLKLEPKEIERLGGLDLFEQAGKRVRYKTFRDVCNEYMAQWPGKSYNSQLLRVSYWCEYFGPRIITDIDVFDIRDHVDSMVEAGKRTATISRDKAVLSSVFKYALGRGYIDRNIVRDVVVSSDSRPRNRVLSNEEREALLSACETSQWPRLKLLVLMAITTGARKSELLNLRWSDINFKTSSALLSDTKNGSSRTLNFPTIVMTELNRFREIGQGLLFESSRKQGKPQDIRKTWTAALKEAGINDQDILNDDGSVKVEKMTFHCLRHGFCSALSDSGKELSEIAELAGHRSLQTTMRYVHQGEQRKQQIVDELAQSFGL